jgi:hypothetical protein
MSIFIFYLKLTFLVSVGMARWPLTEGLTNGQLSHLERVSRHARPRSRGDSAHLARPARRARPSSLGSCAVIPCLYSLSVSVYIPT